MSLILNWLLNPGMEMLVVGRGAVLAGDNPRVEGTGRKVGCVGLKGGKELQSVPPPPLCPLRPGSSLGWGMWKVELNIM